MKLTPEPLVSVVTPVYNRESYLAQCIESVLGQTYQNWEYIIVDNCSTDRTLEIAQSYATRDKRIRLFNNDRFVGPMENHNIGLRKISPKSKYCKLLQSDDWLFPECLRLMVEVAEVHPSVGILGSYRLRGNWVDCDGLPYPSTVVPGREFARFMLLGGPKIYGAISAMMIRSDIVRSRKECFSEAHVYYADIEACYEIFQNWDFGFVHQVLTYFRVHNEMLSAKAWPYRIGMLNQLDLVKRFGPVYLLPEEYEKRWLDVLDEYYRMLGRYVFKLRGMDFWGYHRKALSELGLTFSLTKLVKGTLVEVGRVLFEPLRILWRQIEFIQADRKGIRQDEWKKKPSGL